jgi:hypothetical protein
VAWPPAGGPEAGGGPQGGRLPAAAAVRTGAGAAVTAAAPSCTVCVGAWRLGPAAGAGAAVWGNCCGGLYVCSDRRFSACCLPGQQWVTPSWNRPRPQLKSRSLAGTLQSTTHRHIAAGRTSSQRGAGVAARHIALARWQRLRRRDHSCCTSCRACPMPR